MSTNVEFKWLNEPEEHNYPATLSYLSLLYDEQTAGNYVNKLKHASISEFKAKDVFRASGLSFYCGISVVSFYSKHKSNLFLGSSNTTFFGSKCSGQNGPPFIDSIHVFVDSYSE